MGGEQLYWICEAIDEEKDPECLKLSFHVVEVVMKLFPDPSGLAAQFASEFFEILSKYFPVYFTHGVADDLNATRDDLSKALMVLYLLVMLVDKDLFINLILFDGDIENKIHSILSAERLFTSGGINEFALSFAMRLLAEIKDLTMLDRISSQGFLDSLMMGMKLLVGVSWIGKGLLMRGDEKVKDISMFLLKLALYRAFGHIISNAPVPAVISEAHQILLVIVDSLAKLSVSMQDKDLVYNLLLVLSGMLMDEKGKECILDNIHITISVLTQLVSYPHMMVVRETALQCLVAFSTFPHSVFPMRRKVVFSLALSLMVVKLSIE
nr:unnamed protein product [Digitaria exilis]